MKKIISAVICLVLAAGGAISASAVITDDDLYTGLSLNDFMYNCRVIGSDTIPNNTARLYTYGAIGSAEDSIGITFVESSTYERTDCTFNTQASYRDVYLPSPNYYMSDHMFKSSSGSNGGSGPDFYLNSSGGTYKKVRVKLSAYSDYFNSDGTHTKDGHNYNFTKQDNGYLSSLLICSGGAVTAVTPDHYGFVEFYCSNQIGVPTEFSTNFSHRTSTSFSGGGGTTAQNLGGFMVGDTNSDGFISIYDVTLFQMYIAGMQDLSDITKINSDINSDGKIDVNDATEIQKYLAGIL